MSIPPSFPDPEAPPVKSLSADKNSPAEQGSNIPMSWKQTVAEPVPCVRCTGTIRNGPKKGERCGNWSLRGATVCLKHGGHLPNVRAHADAVVEAARMKLIGLADEAVDTIEDLMINATQEQVRLKAATEVLDRSGIKGAIEVKVEVSDTTPPSETINERLAQIAARLKPAEPEPEELIDEGEATGE